MEQNVGRTLGVSVAGRVSQSAGHHTQVGVSVAGPGREGVTECRAPHTGGG